MANKKRDQMREYRFIAALVVLLVPGFAQDVLMESDTEEGELLRVQNTGTSMKTLISAHNIQDATAIEITGGSTGINAQLSGSNGALGLNLNVTAPDYAKVFQGAAYAEDDSYNHGMDLTVEGGNYSSNYGIMVNVSGGGASENWGVYSSVSGGSSSTSKAGYFDGQLWYGTTHAISDQKLKKNIRDLNGGIATVMALKPRLYEMRTDEYKGKMNLAQGEQIGFIAQEMETVLPQLVSNGAAPAHLTGEERKNNVRKEPTRFKGVDYTGVIPVLVKAVQEQQALIEALRAEVAALKK
jgi:hypothetical protein